MSTQEIKARLFEMQDLEYKDFHSRLMPTVSPDKIIGVRVPLLRKYAKELYKTGDTDEFLKTLPHDFYEENNLHAFLLEQIKDFDTAVQAVDDFLPYIDNWATCDTMCPKIFGKYPDRLLPVIKIWIASRETYTIRYAIGLLMRFYLDGNFKAEYLDAVVSVQSDEYYVNMMRAWFFATALAKQYDAAILYIKNRRLDTWTHNKAIQKARESYRITKEQKEYLKTLKAG